MRITLSERAVVAVGYRFSPRRETYADASVARDEVRALPRPAEPSVVRVRARGGGATERALVVGDWLRDPELDEPLRIPEPRWSYSAATPCGCWMPPRMCRSIQGK